VRSWELWFAEKVRQRAFCPWPASFRQRAYSLDISDADASSPGTAAICLLSEHMTVVRQRIDVSIPRKRKGGTSGHEKVS